jgi:hypothetical protein
MNTLRGVVVAMTLIVMVPLYTGKIDNADHADFIVEANFVSGKRALIFLRTNEEQKNENTHQHCQQ